MLAPDKTSALVDAFTCQTRSNNRQSEAPESALLLDGSTRTSQPGYLEHV